MGFKLNPLTGDLDITNYPFKTGTVQPVLTQDGQVALTDISGEGRVYFKTDGNLYYVTGTQIIVALNIVIGQPIGLAGVTYAEDVP